MPNKGVAAILTDKMPIRMKDPGYRDVNCIWKVKNK